MSAHLDHLPRLSGEWSSPVPGSLFEDGDGSRRWRIGQADRPTFIAFLPVRVDLASPHLIVALRTTGWKRLDSVSIGWHDGARYWSDKVRHPPLGRWFEGELRFKDIAFMLSNPRTVTDEFNISSIRLVFKGVAGPETIVDLGSVQLGVMDRSHYPAAIGGDRRALVAWQRIDDRMNKNRLHRARGMLEGRYQLGGVPEVGPLSLADAPAGSSLDGYRSRWHSLDPVRILLGACRDSASQEYLALATEIALDWTARFSVPSRGSGSHLWNDRVLAMRALALTDLVDAMHTASVLDDRSWRMLSAVLGSSIEALGRESFVSRYQRLRIHKYAVYQALAVLVATSTLSFSRGEHLAQVARERLVDQFEGFAARGEAAGDQRDDLPRNGRELCRAAIDILGGGPEAERLQNLEQELSSRGDDNAAPGHE